MYYALAIFSSLSIGIYLGIRITEKAIEWKLAKLGERRVLLRLKMERNHR